MTIKRKFLLCGILMFAALGAIGLLAGMAVRDAQHDQVAGGLEAVASLEASRIEDLLDRSTAGLEHGVELLQLGAAMDRGADRAELGATLDLLSESERSVVASTLVDPSGAVLATSGGVPTVAAPAPLDATVLAAAIASIDVGGEYAVGPGFRTEDGRELYTHVVPVNGSAPDAVAYLVAEFELAPIQVLFGEHEVLGATAEAHLVQATPEGAQFITDLRFATEPARFDMIVPRTKKDAPAVLAAFGPSRTYDDLVDYRGEAVIASVRHLPRTPWAMVVKVDRDEAYAAYDRAIRLGVIGLSGALLLSAMALTSASRSVLRRIRKVAESAAAISAGDLTARVGDRSRDELGILARSFDQMADTLVADMTRRREMEAELAHRARHDALTALPNRLAFQHELKASLNHEQGTGSIAVLFCDLDEFKTVNDDLGHSAGDALLREVSARLRRAIPPQHILARFGGDEFVVVARGLADAAEAVAIADQMCEELSAPIALGGRDVFVTTSVGVAISHPGSTAETLVRDADAAMYQAKSRGRARVVVHDAGIGARANNRLAMTTELHRAIANGGLTVALQPIADLATGEVHAMEVLVRWEHDGREIDPSEFVMRATELDLAGALDRWVLTEACRLMTELRGLASAETGWLHVNVTGTSLVDEAFADDVLGALALHRVSPFELCLEIVEDRLGGAPHAALATLDRLRQAGVRVAIDDFGTGHSSLARLRDLPADTVKIDQSFIRDLAADPAALAITGSIIGLADQLGLDVVAEGIEHREQVAMLASLGCRYGQGYLIGPPRKAEQVVETRVVADDPSRFALDHPIVTQTG